MTADLRQDLVILLANNDHLIDRPAELASRILDLFADQLQRPAPGRDPEWAHRLAQALDAEREATDRWVPEIAAASGRIPAARQVTDALVEEGAR